MAESSTKRSFPADIFAEDNDKWSWSAPTVNNKPSVPNYAALRKATKDEASSSSGSENESSAFRSDSNSIKRSFRKRSSSNSEGNPLEDASSSPNHSSAMPRERLLPPSMYDDDARSASPSAYEKKDLAFAALFQKEFHPIAPGSSADGSSPPYEGKHDRRRSAPEKEMVRKYNKGLSPSETSPKRSSKAETSSKSRDRRSSRSKSRERTRRSRSRSKGRRTKSPARRRSRSRDRPTDRDRRRHSKSRSRRSHSRESKSRRSHSPRDSRRRSRSRSRDRRRSRSRGGYRRSRSRSYDRSSRSRRGSSSSRDRYSRRKGYSRSRSRSRDRSKGRSGVSGNRKLGSLLPLSSTPGGATGMTPQMALQQTMAAMSAKAQALTGIALPKYYNPAAVNPLKYAEQVQKRKLLWQQTPTTDKVEEQPKSSVWDKLTFAQDQDGKMTAKFRKLMGIKSENPIPPEEEKESVLKKQEELFRDLDQQYEMARMTTHTQRGVGLGYSAQTALFPPIPK